ncbi:hypothetical protein [Vibrio gallaecicus]|uniref:hypothetical protein n=1 Tax=Vibrio gallaecicus TaxID=552386 RepID=UPI0025B3DF33|nr:hypothetical protein [Vibrio gallaecicus]MDN3617055.1 hypothetical protein [Vibrio gallaecicus]
MFYNTPHSSPLTPWQSISINIEFTGRFIGEPLMGLKLNGYFLCDENHNVNHSTS